MTEFFPDDLLRMVGTDNELLLDHFLEDHVKSIPGFRERTSEDDLILTEDATEYLTNLRARIYDDFRRRIENGTNFIVFTSMQEGRRLNIRSIIFIKPHPDFWNPDSRSYLVRLCFCGNLDHWGESGYM